MKKQLLILSCLVLTTLSLYAQAPEKLNYQGIARSTSGLPMQNRNLGLRISILDGATAVYVETNNVSTNGFGLYKLAIGAGIPVSGSMGTVNWSSGNKFIKVEIDPQGGTNYSSLGTNELLSVPYALYAASSGGSGDGSPTGAAGGDLTGTYPNPEIADNAIYSNHIKDGEVKTVDLANNTVTTAKIANDAITSPKIANMGATNGQVLKFNGTNWIPGADNEGAAGTTYTAGDGIAISGTNEISADLGTDISTNELQNAAVTTPKIANGAITAEKLNQMNAVNGQVLPWNGAEWIPANAGGGAGDDWGTQVAQTTHRLTGDGTAANPLDIAQQGAANGQVLKWNGANWIPADDEVGGGGASDDWGTQVVIADTTLDGEGTNAFPLGLANAAVTGEKINQMGAANGQVLKWNGVTWEPANDVGGGAGDDWGAQVAETDASLTGEGTVVDPLGVADNGITTQKLVATAVTTPKIADGAITSPKIDDMGAVNGQVLKFDGNSWGPGNEMTGNAGWSLEGNVASATDFIGTINDEALRFKQNGGHAGFIKGDNTAYGLRSLPESSTGVSNTAIGYEALYFNTTGEDNTATGDKALYANTTGNWNVANGMNALHSNTIGFLNTAIGIKALFSNTTGFRNTATGSSALYYNTTGGNNTASGQNSLNRNTTGGFNTASGYHSLGNSSVGTHNIAFGFAALQTNGVGNYNTGIGARADVGGGNLMNATAVGAQAQVAQSNSLILGSIAGVNSATANTKVGIGITAPSGQLEIKGKSAGENPQLMLNEDSVDYARLYFQNSNPGRWTLAGRTDADTGKSLFNVYYSLAAGGGRNVLQISGQGKVGVNYEPISTSISEAILSVKGLLNVDQLSLINTNGNSKWGFFSNAGTALALYRNGVYRGNFNGTSGAYSSTSDRSLKGNITPTQSLLSKVQEIKIMNYTYKEDKTQQPQNWVYRPRAGKTIS